VRIDVWVYTQIDRDYENADGREIESYWQGYVYSNRDIDVLFEIEQGGMPLNMEHNTKHAARETQVYKQVEKKAYTHDTDWQKQANKQGMCMRETEAANIGKAPRLGIYTLEWKLYFQQAMPPMWSPLWEEYCERTIEQNSFSFNDSWATSTHPSGFWEHDLNCFYYWKQ